VTTRRRVGIYNLYWSTYGGGEQVSGAIAERLAAEHDVVLLGPEPVDADATRARLGVDLSGCGYERVVDDDAATEASSSFDLFVNGTYRSHAASRAPASLYYVHFPEPPPTSADRRRQAVSRVAAGLLGRFDRLPAPVEGARLGFERRSGRQEWVRSYTSFLANSEFTAGWVQRLWGVPAEIVHPPVRPEVSPGVKAPLVASVGRFFDPSLGHSKKQLDLLRAFVALHRSGRAPGWELALVGGADAASREYALAVRREAVGQPVHVHLNAPRRTVDETLAAASIYWHATGFGEDVERHPERFEHFGIAVVEAMAAGAVPVVFGAAGPAEIVRHGIDGLQWHSTDELVALTAELIADPDRRAGLADAARERARAFTSEVFARRLDEVVSAALARAGA
jgi:glycosyltransferase involved in cell wall biosynthesis